MSYSFTDGVNSTIQGIQQLSIPQSTKEEYIDTLRKNTDMMTGYISGLSERGKLALLANTTRIKELEDEITRLRRTIGRITAENERMKRHLKFNGTYSSSDDVSVLYKD